MEQQILPQFLFLADLIVFLSVVSIHLTGKTVSVVHSYAIQSLVIVSLLFYTSIVSHSFSLLIVALLIFAVKVVIAPRYFLKLLEKHQVRSTENNYLSMPATLAVIAAITMLTHTKFFQPLVLLAPLNQDALLISIAAIFISLILIINRRGALSQMVGILCLENSIFSFFFAAGLGQGPGLELGIVFDVLVWILIATTFISMVYRKFGTLDVTTMTDLKG